MNSAETQAQRAMVMTSTHPPTNPILLARWRDEATDENLKSLINKWMMYCNGQIKAFDFNDIHEKVHEKVISGFYSKV